MSNIVHDNIRNVVFVITDFRESIDVDALNHCVSLFGKDCRFVEVDTESDDSVIVAGSKLTKEQATAAYDELE